MLLEADEQAVADKGYRGEPLTIALPGSGETEEEEEAMARARMRHETCNKRFKNFACMTMPFRHGLGMHYDCMHAIVVLTQLEIENGHPLFDAAFMH